MDNFRSRQGSLFSFLPTHRQAAYECLLGALEMGYNIDGYLVVDQVSRAYAYLTFPGLSKEHF